MPCYEPPPAWEGAARRNAEEAAQILCATVRDMLDQDVQGIPDGMLRWYLDHRRIDLLQVDDPDPRNRRPEISREAILADIARVEAMVKPG